MKIKNLNKTVSVSDQIIDSDIKRLKDEGVAIIVCNRPDRESAHQPTFLELQNTAKELGIEAIHMPFSGGNISHENIHKFKKLLVSNKRIHAYCRTGNRSTNLFNAAHAIKAENTTQLSPESKAKLHFDVVIIGAGSAGIAVAASLLKRKPTLRVAIVEPSTHHYYQPGWTLVGAGVFIDKDTLRPIDKLIPKGATWINESAQYFFENDNYVCLSNQNHIHYNHLVIATGLKLDWDEIEGLSETLGKNGVTSNYRYDLAPYTWELTQNLKKGTAIFTQAPMPIKCAGAPQKALYLCADHWFKQQCLNDIDINFYNAGRVLFGIEAYVPALYKYIKKYRAKLHFDSTLIKIDGNSKTAWFKQKNSEGSESIISKTFDMIHVCPSQSPPECIKSSRLCDINGWLSVNQYTLQHTNINNIWGLGDVTNTPNAKIMAAARKQAPVVAQNICDAIMGLSPSAQYDGYGSCPLTVERGKVVLSEFLYNGKVAPSFPKFINDGTRPTKLAWFLKARILPLLYWHGMLKGREWLAKPMRKKSNRV
ncbi:bifunctional protein tyrosine phosphatase family protein/NAD(P)/FAD-dependent oxidoreductase [Marinagarivorans algicola]|uniref:bifunctional protein tyrosine phosphatase family protein/NAD(P)/FAD-dependent oxidoreductase n=1 Tax=Marinagarivorans algicola TaxID=1513270 RepID=UPI0006B992ED|nr:bifunctional protein tyrosine phosphatase family protein/NAD(P)/FAD-dependent oxidoreductase [Marinagarivorans algicola]